MTGTTSNVTFGNGSEFGAKFSSNDLVCPKFNKVPVKTTAADHKDRFEPKVKGFRKHLASSPFLPCFCLKFLVCRLLRAWESKPQESERSAILLPKMAYFSYRFSPIPSCSFRDGGIG